jgi:predicted Rdx family selenoprotein
MRPELVEGSGGIFEVRMGDQVVYTNGGQGGVPDPQQVLPAVRQKVGTSR